MAVVEHHESSEFAHERAQHLRRTIADTLLQLVVQGVVDRESGAARALAALGLTWPDLEAAQMRRRRVGWTGPQPGPVPAGAPARPLPVSTIEHATTASHSSARYQAANPAPGVKRCARCRDTFPVESFRLKSASSGSTIRWSYCEPCRKEKQRERYLSVRKAQMLNQVGLSFIVSEVDDVAGLACLNCLQPIKAGEHVHGRASLTHEHCPG